MWNRFWDLLDGWVFGSLALQATPHGRALRILRYPYALIRDLARGEINLRAMGLVYMTLLSLVPLVAFSFAVLKGFGAHRDLEPIVYEFFRPVGRAATGLTAQVMAFADSVSSGLVGSVGFVLLLWTLIGTIRKVEDSFNYLWRVEQPRSFARRVTEYVALLIIGPLLLVVFAGLAHAAIDSSAVREVSAAPAVAPLRDLLLVLAPYAMVSAIFVALYLWVPNTSVRWWPALVGGLVAGVLWAAVGKLFTELVVYTARLTIVYAGFAFIVSALLWTYFGWLILLIGAQLAFYLQNPSYLRLGLTPLRLSNVELEDLSLRVMYLVGRAHLQGAKGWTTESLSSELGVPGIAIADITSSLENARLLDTTDENCFVPARDIGRIRVREILEVVRNRRTGHAPRHDAGLAPVDRLADRLTSAWRSACGDLSLRELVEEPA